MATRLEIWMKIEKSLRKLIILWNHNQQQQTKQKKKKVYITTDKPQHPEGVLKLNSSFKKKKPKKIKILEKEKNLKKIINKSSPLLKNNNLIELLCTYTN